MRRTLYLETVSKDAIAILSSLRLLDDYSATCYLGAKIQLLSRILRLTMAIYVQASIE